jgi:phosphoribosylamine--glycine ligase
MVSFLAMKILVIGGGGREHALAWKLRQSGKAEQLWCAPGNGGIARDAECLPVSAADTGALVALGTRLSPDLTVVGPEQPLVAGLVDEFAARGLKIVGPTQAAAQLEGSKIFAKQFLSRQGIPTPALRGIYDAPEKAYDALRDVVSPIVIKADGPCAGKGVLVTSSAAEAKAFVERLMEQREFGASGSQLLIEEAVTGRELSFIVLTDGEHTVSMVPAQDHKRAFDGDQGPNTGGMGAFSADGMLSPTLEQEILETVVRPTLAGMAREGTPYRGFLYCGLMLTAEGPKVLEFNCRMGDPECQAIVARMDFDLAEVLAAAADGRLDRVPIAWRPGASVCVVLASGGYPGKYETGKPIAGLAEAEAVADVAVFHAGTRRQGAGYLTAGGRVLGVTATGPDLAAAAARAYQAAERIRWLGRFYRKDIGKKK